jgi:hypothetical protein
MDLSFMYNAFSICDEAKGIPSEYRSRRETLYYDETDNVKYVRIKNNGRLNIDNLDTIFVLGGIQSDCEITEKEFKELFGKKKELKAKTDLKGDFLKIMSKEIVEDLLKLIYLRRWCIHCLAVQPIYYSFVDIVDSLFDNEVHTLEYKSLMCHIFKFDFDFAITILKKYKYPNIKDKEVVNFLDDLAKLVEKYLLQTQHDIYEEEMLNDLFSSINEVKSGNKKLKLLCNEESNSWVNSFSWFYFKEIASFPSKKLVFDQEDQVENQLRKDPIIVNEVILSNYSFVKSSDSPIIQLCDYVVAILKKYFVFLDRDFSLIEKDVFQLNQVQLVNFMMFNTILLYSREYNPLFFNYIMDNKIPQKVDYYMCRFGA